MGLAFGQLRLTPEQFWRISPKELQAALDGYLNGGFWAEGSAVLGRRELDA
ncbi:MAG: phage tail assembly chaperone, partial [Alphaproteobacteria bacterium]